MRVSRSSKDRRFLWGRSGATLEASDVRTAIQIIVAREATYVVPNSIPLFAYPPILTASFTNVFAWALVIRGSLVSNSSSRRCC